MTTTKISRAQRRYLHESDALFQQAVSQRQRQQVLVTGVKIAATVSVIDPADFDRLHIDDRYQRVRLGNEVNDLKTVILAGGQIPDPVDIAERPDGTLWIVDGQQRFWAHKETNTPLKANIHKVESLDAEQRLFMVLNSRRRLTARAVMRGWSGKFGEFLRWCDESPESPLKGMVDFSNNSKRPFDAPTLAKGLMAALLGTEYGADTATVLMPRMDFVMRQPHAHAWAKAFVQLLAAVFGPTSGRGGTRVRRLPVIALGLVAHQRFVQAGRPIFPTTTGRLRQVNWDLQVPSHARKYLPLLVEKMQRKWRI